MLKKFASLILVLSASTAMAAPYGLAGCGLGNLLFKKDTQVLAATTNGSSYSQSFGITSGTSNCVDTEGHAKLKNFIDGNRLALENDVSRADGETLKSVAFYFGCQNSESFRQTLQSNFGQIFSPEKDSNEVFDGLKQTLNSNQTVASSCSELG